MQIHLKLTRERPAARQGTPGKTHIIHSRRCPTPTSHLSKHPTAATQTAQTGPGKVPLALTQVSCGFPATSKWHLGDFQLQACSKRNAEAGEPSSLPSAWGCLLQRVAACCRCMEVALPYLTRCFPPSLQSCSRAKWAPLSHHCPAQRLAFSRLFVFFSFPLPTASPSHQFIDSLRLQIANHSSSSSSQRFWWFLDPPSIDRDPSICSSRRAPTSSLVATAHRKSPVAKLSLRALVSHQNTTLEKRVKFIKIHHHIINSGLLYSCCWDGRLVQCLCTSIVAWGEFPQAILLD